MKPNLASALRLVLVALCVIAALPTPALAKAAVGSAVPSALDTCSWDRPGHDPFMGDVVAAVDRYADIPADVRQRIKARMTKRDYDDVVSIRRDSIAGKTKKVRYGSAIRDMHFGDHKLCHTVSRSAWTKDTQERGLVYCDSGQCILVPTVCRNVSRIARAEVAHERAEGDEPESGAVPVATIDPDPAPLPLDLLPAPFALDADPGVGTFAEGDRIGAFGVGFVGGSFAAATGAGPAIAAITASTGKGGFEQAAPTPPGTDVAGTVAAVPEPETWGLMIAGLAAVAARRRRRA